jgi:hypothetical protein
MFQTAGIVLHDNLDSGLPLMPFNVRWVGKVFEADFVASIAPVQTEEQNQGHIENLR